MTYLLSYHPIQIQYIIPCLEQCDKKQNSCFKIVQDKAPWEMIKATSASCLCSGGEGVYALRWSMSGACNVIANIAKHVQTTTKETTNKRIPSDLV
jgi:hypothetical protein